VFQLVAQNNGVVQPAVWENSLLADSIRFKSLDLHYERTNQQYPDSALAALAYHIKFAKEKRNDRQLFTGLKRRGNILRLQQKYPEAMVAYQQAERIAEKLDDPLLIGDINGNIGNVYIYTKDYVLATRRFTTALSIYQRIGHVEGETRMLTNLGSVFLIIHNYQGALDYYTKVLSSLTARNINDRSTAIVYVNMGWAFFEQQQYTQARDHYLKALDILEREKSLFFVADCYTVLASIFHKLKEPTMALSYALKSQALNLQLGSHQGVLAAKVVEAEIRFDISPRRALQLVEPMIINVSKTNDNQLKKRLFELLYRCYKDLGRPKEALRMHELYTAYIDSVYLEINQFNVIQEAFKRDNEVQIAQAALINQQEKELLKTRQFRMIIILIIIFFLVVGVLIFWKISADARNKIKLTELLREIERLKEVETKDLSITTEAFPLSRERIEKYIDRKINETDWKVLNILLQDPSISNKEIADRAFMSIDGIGSSLRRMYDYFEIKDSKYKKITLIIKAMNITKG
jgi:tetratricopeptide (TPR) repeat protein